MIASILAILPRKQCLQMHQDKCTHSLLMKSAKNAPKVQFFKAYHFVLLKVTLHASSTKSTNDVPKAFFPKMLFPNATSFIPVHVLEYNPKKRRPYENHEKLWWDASWAASLDFPMLYPRT